MERKRKGREEGFALYIQRTEPPTHLYTPPNLHDPRRHDPPSMKCHDDSNVHTRLSLLHHV